MPSEPLSGQSIGGWASPISRKIELKILGLGAGGGGCSSILPATPKGAATAQSNERVKNHYRSLRHSASLPSSATQGRALGELGPQDCSCSDPVAVAEIDQGIICRTDGVWTKGGHLKQKELKRKQKQIGDCYGT